jgi:hypothetical protein
MSIKTSLSIRQGMQRLRAFSAANVTPKIADVLDATADVSAIRPHAKRQNPE